MAELVARSGLEGPRLPLEAGQARLAALPEAAMLSVAPFRGREQEVADVLGVALPVGATVAARGGLLIWAGMGVWFLRRPGDVAARLAGVAAVTEQGDGWCGLALSGPAAGAVLARLVPVDLDPAVFPAGSAARSMLRHVPLLLLAVEGGFELFVPRSYVRTAVHEVGVAMATVAARTEVA